MQGLTASAAARNCVHPHPKTTLIIRSHGALALWVLCGGVTLKVLLAGVGSVADITTDHLVTITVLATTMAAAHMLWPQVKQWRVVPALGLALLLVASTFYIVTSSAARNAEVDAAKTADVRKANEDRARVQSKLDEANTRLAKARTAEADAAADAKKECATGKGKRCDGARASSEDARTKTSDIASSVAILEAEMRLMKAPAQENAGLKHAARVFASLPFAGADADAIARLLELWWPFVKTLVLELGTVVFGSLAFGHRTVRRVKDEPASEPDGPAEPSAKTPPRSPRPRGGISGRFDKERACADLLTRLGLGQSVPSQDDLARAWNRPKSTVSDWLREWEKDGLIPARRTVGRRKQLVAA